MAAHETTAFSQNYFRRRIHHVDQCVRDDGAVRPGVTRRSVDQLLGTVWTINPDGTFHAMTTKPKAEIWGTYTLAGDTMTVQETRQAGRVPKNCNGPGVYKFSRPDGNTLAFVLVSDKCKPRIQNVTQPWRRQ